MTFGVEQLETRAMLAVASFEVEVTQLDGSPLQGPLLVGDSFLLSAYSEDIRDNPQGIFSAYLDVLYNSSLVEPNGPLAFDGPYENVLSGSLATPGVIDEVGGSASLSPLGAGQFLVFSVPMVATGVGSATFTADPPDDLPLHRVLFFGSNEPIDANDIEFGQATVDIVTTVSVDDVQVNETNGPTTASFTVSLGAANPVDVTVDYETLADSATAGVDFQSVSGTVTIPATQLSATIEVPILGDTLHEFDETFSLVLSNVTGAELVDPTGVATILDDDPPPSVSINSVSAPEGNVGTSNALFLVTLSTASGRPITVDFATANGSAIAGTDYVAQSGTLTFDPGTTSRTISVPVSGDVLDEDDETFFVNLSNPSNVVLDVDQGVGTILDNDPPPSVSIDSVSRVEGNSGTANAVFTLSLSAASGKQVSVNFATSNGSATAGADYESTSGSAMFAPGITSQTISVPIIGDLLDENDETFFVNLTGAINATIGAGEGAGLIVDNDEPPTLAINDVSLTEGNSGTTNMVFTVSLSVASGRAVSVNYSTASGTAAAGQDFNATSGTLNFAPGVTTQTISVPIVGDTLDELDETYFVNLSSAVNASIADGQGLGTILDNDAPPAMSISDVSVVEGNLGTTNAVLTVNLSVASGRTVTVNYATANGSATAGADYTAQSGTLTFPAGTTSRTITVPIAGDLLDESDESFFVNLSGAVGATVIDGQGIVTINDDDEPASSLSGYVYLDGNGNGLRDANERGIGGVSVTLSGTNDLGQPVGLMRSTDASGFYRFDGLRPGTYTITEIHPGFFRDGLEAAGTQGGTVVANDAIQTTIATTVAGAENNFGELGLRTEFVSRRLFLASSLAEALVNGSYVVDTSSGDVWFAVDRGWNGTLAVQATPAAGTEATLTLYDNNLNPLTSDAPGSGPAEIAWAGSSMQSYFLRVGGGSSAVELRLSTIGSGPSAPSALAAAGAPSPTSGSTSGAAPQASTAATDKTMAYWAAFSSAQQQSNSDADDAEEWGHAVDQAMRFLARSR